MNRRAVFAFETYAGEDADVATRSDEFSMRYFRLLRHFFGAVSARARKRRRRDASSQSGIFLCCATKH
jgi:hypothetical protein